MMNVVSHALVPSGFALVLFLAGLTAAALRRTRWFSWPLLAASGAVTLTFSLGTVAAALIGPLEYAWPTVHDPKLFAAARHIVVLTGWASPDPNLPLTGRMNSAAAYRVMLALELHRSRPDCDVIVTGPPASATVMAEALRELGISAELVRTETGSSSTVASARNVGAMVGSDTFFLVTSAGHMPRAVQAFSRFGLNAVPTPTDHQQPKDWSKAEWLPSAESLRTSDLAVHEYLSLAWYALEALVRKP